MQYVCYFCGVSSRLLHMHIRSYTPSTQATAAARLADTLFIGFAICPDWPPSVPLRACDIDVNMVATRQVAQDPRLQRALEKIKHIVQEELAVPHITAYHDKLHEIVPAPGHNFDGNTLRFMNTPLQLVARQPDEPLCM